VQKKLRVLSRAGGLSYCSSLQIMEPTWDASAAYRRWYEGGFCWRWPPDALENFDERMRRIWLDHVRQVCPTRLILLYFNFYIFLQLLASALVAGTAASLAYAALAAADPAAGVESEPAAE
jgi:hypothetical protein